MAREYTKFFRSFWNSQKVQQLDAGTKLIYIFLLTNPHINGQTGLYVMRPGVAEDYLRRDIDTLSIPYRMGIDALCDAGLIAYDPYEHVIRLKNFIQMNKFSGIKVIKGCMNATLNIPDCAEKLHVLNELWDQPGGDKLPELEAEIERVKVKIEGQTRYPIDTLSIQGEGKLKTETETETSTNHTLASAAISPPEPKKTGSEYTQEFEQWWSHYPRKAKKAEAFRAYKRAKGKVGADRLAQALEQQLPRLQAEAGRTDGNFCPYPASWLNGGSYDDPEPEIQNTIYDDMENITNGYDNSPDPVSPEDRSDHQASLPIPAASPHPIPFDD